jgi:hypothetical protein
MEAIKVEMREASNKITISRHTLATKERMIIIFQVEEMKLVGSMIKYILLSIKKHSQ